MHSVWINSGPFSANFDTMYLFQQVLQKECLHFNEYVALPSPHRPPEGEAVPVDGGVDSSFREPAVALLWGRRSVTVTDILLRSYSKQPGF